MLIISGEERIALRSPATEPGVRGEGESMAFMFEVRDLGYFVVEGNPGDPSSARLLPVPPDAAAEELRWRDVPTVLPVVPRRLGPADCPVRLRPEGLGATILGEPVIPPVGVALRAVSVLTGIYPEGVPAAVLNEMANAKDAGSALRSLADLDWRWKRVLRFPATMGGRRGGRIVYRIADPKLDPD